MRAACGDRCPGWPGWPVSLEGGRGISSAAVTGSASSGIREVELSIRGMTCAACAARVEKKPNAMDDVLATVNFAAEEATVTPADSLEQVVSCPG
jgi:hypothetical protein